jgi:hypothetical protein
MKTNIGMLNLRKNSLDKLEICGKIIATNIMDKYSILHTELVKKKHLWYIYILLIVIIANESR